MQTLHTNSTELPVMFDAFALFRQSDLTAPVAMLNQLKFNDEAAYEAGSNEPPASGAEAYRRYGAGVMPLFREMGAKVLFDGTLPLIGPTQEWDRIFVVRYPSRNAFLAMISDPAYAAVAHHRAAAVRDSRVFALDELEIALDL